ncbi:hypothetical protein GAY31_09425 [Azospirillum brasilense]|nr:hypothetical protein [Azospirillum brasilense]
MISVLVYGRNDSHGYNLHKRAAISLNSIASVLADPDDEIVFVDYNTPDDHPTFIEAILDTLTERCRQRLRVLRVRPSLHERYRPHTPYAALEAIARNIGARRTNPKNRWILSTNTDMVFVPDEVGRSLTDIAAGAPDGFYQLPRYEIPETLWEGLDRRNPQGTIDSFRRWGQGLHLAELVHTDPWSEFDGIGDFQLFLRKDFHAIHGFNEEMLAGWNVDMNLCRRLRLYRGGMGTLMGQLSAYHCDHTRQSTPIHHPDTVMNDWFRYILELDSAFLPNQAESWGMPDEEIEEFRASCPPSARFAGTLASLLPPPPATGHEGWNDDAVRYRLRYDPMHVLPYLMDHLSSLPRDITIAWAGNNRSMLALFRRAWTAMGGNGPIVVLRGTAAATDDGGGTERIVDERIFDRQAGIFVFEFGLDDDRIAADPDPGFRQLDPEARQLLGLVKGAFLRQAERERQRPRDGAGAGRRFLAIHAVNTYFGELVADHLDCPRTMFSTRVRTGYVHRPQPRSGHIRRPSEPDATLSRRLGRARPIDHHEVLMGFSDARRAMAATTPADLDPRSCHALLLALLDSPFLDLPADRRRELQGWVASRRPSATLRPLLDAQTAAAGRPAGPPSLNKLAAAEDWEDLPWFTWAHQLTSEGLSYISSTYNHFKRSRGVWERAHLLYGLDRLGALSTEASLAVVCDTVDGLPLFLADRVDRVDVIDVGPDAPHTAGRTAVGEPDPWLAKGRLFRPDSLTVHHTGKVAPLPGGPWDAVIITQGTLLRRGADGLRTLLSALEPLLPPGGILAFSAEVAVSENAEPGPWLSVEKAVRLVPALTAHSGLRGTGALDLSLGDATLDRLAEDGGVDVTRPHFAIRTDGTVHVNAVFFLRKEAPTPPDAWKRVVATLWPGAEPTTPAGET